jgi:hypothetical protein
VTGQPPGKRADGGTAYCGGVRGRPPAAAQLPGVAEAPLPGVAVSVGPADWVPFAEDVLVAGDVVGDGGVVVGVGVTTGVVVGVVVTGVVVGVVDGVVDGVVTGVVSDVYGMVVGDVSGNVVDRLAGEVEAGHVTLAGGCPIWGGAGPRAGGMYTVPLAWRAATVPLVPCEPWSRHRVLPGAMVARNGFPGMCVTVAEVSIRVELLD